MRIPVYVLVACLCPASWLSAQTPGGTLEGRVSDPSGAALQGAMVHVTCQDVAFDYVTATDGRGAYLALPPVGRCSVEVQYGGFKPATKPFRINTGERVALDVQLGVANVTAAVDVEVATADTIAASKVRLDAFTITQLPLPRRDLFFLALLDTGVSPAAERSQNSTQGGAVSINGAREQSNSFRLDGVDNNDLLINQMVVQPSLDAVEELTIQKSTYAAEFGRNAGGQFNFVTKSGTDQWRGSLYEFFRNAALDARNFFDHGPESSPRLNRDLFGATLGAPIKKGRLFAFASYEGLRTRQSFSRIATVPPAAWRSGDFSSLLTGRTNAAGFDTGQLFYPFTTIPIAGNRIPAGQIDPIGQTLLGAYPLPDDAGARGPSAATVHPIGSTDTNQVTLRVDYRRPSGETVFVRYNHTGLERMNPFDPFVDPTNVPGFGSRNSDNTHAAAVNHTRALGSLTVNELRFGVTRLHAGTFQEQTSNVAGDLGIPGLSDDPGHWGVPGVILGITDPLIDPYNAPQDRRVTTLHLSDSLSWVRGAHAFKAGADVRHYALDYYLDLYARGQLTYVGFSGNPIADLLLGQPAAAMRMNPSYDTNQNVRTTAVSGYIQDSWRIGTSLTVDAGLRYDYAQPPYETENRFSVPVLTSETPKYLLVGTDGVPRAGFEADSDNFAPRLGAAWRPLHASDSTLVIRGGYGIFYDAGILNLNIFPRYNPPFFSLDLFLGPSSTASAYSGAGIPLSAANGIDESYRDAYYHQFSAGVEQRIAKIGMAQIGYVGSRGRHLQLMRDLNQGPAGGPPLLNPVFGPARIGTSDGWSSYDALQVRVERPLTRGFTVLGAYTYSRSLDNASSLFGSAGSSDFPQNSFDLTAERGPSSFDVPHRLVISSVWEIPTSKSLATGSAWARALASGWSLAGIVTVQSGLPFTVYYGPSVNYSGTDNGGVLNGPGRDRPNQLRDPGVERDPNRWFDPTAFAPAINDFGNAQRNSMRGDALRNVDLALHKAFTLQTTTLQFRAEVFNALNRPFFFLPVADLTMANAGQVTRAGDARQIQLGLKVLF